MMYKYSQCTYVYCSRVLGEARHFKFATQIDHAKYQPADDKPLMGHGQCHVTFINFGNSSKNAFSALTLWAGWQEGHPACKN